MAVPFSRRAPVREFREHGAIWVVYFTAIGMLHATLANFPEQLFADAGIPREMFFATIPFPLAWFAVYFLLRIRKTRWAGGGWKAYLALAALVVGVPLAILFFYRPYPFTRGQVKGLYEISAFFWATLIIIHVLLARGRQTLALFFGVGFFFGLILENSGIIMGFFKEPGFLIYLGRFPAPLCTMLSWSEVLAIVVLVTDRLGEWVPWLAPSKGLWRRVGTATAMALCLDAQIDPLASMSGILWRWNDILPRAFFGVPFVNFAAWFGAVSAFCFAIFWVRDHAEWSPGRKNLELLLRVPWAGLLAWALCFAVMAIAEGGFGGPSFQILGAYIDKLLVP